MTPADIEVQEGENTYYAKVVDAVAKIGTEKFESIEAAVAAAKANDEITLLKDCAITSTITMKATVGLYIDKNITINCGGYTLTGPTGEAVYGIVIGADVTISNGTIAAAANSFLINIGNAGDFGEDGFEGNLTLDNVVVEGKGPNNNGNSIAAAKGTVTIDNGCRFTKLGTRGIKAEGTASVTINDATIDLANAYSGTISVYAKETGSITINGGSIAGTIEKAGDAVITIPGTSKATFNRDQTAFCVTGYKTKELETGVWSVVQIQYATLKVAAGDGFVSDIVVTNASGTVVAADTQFDVDDAVVIAYKSATFTSGYELDESTGTLVVTLDQAGEATIEVFSKKTQSTPVIDPTKPSEPMSKDAADAAAAEINAHPEKYIKVPEAFGDIGQTALATYQTYFTAVVTGSGDNSKVELVLNTTGETALQNSVNGDVVKIKPAEIAAGTATNVKIDAIPGFYYGVKAGNGIGNMAIKSSVPATSAELTLDLPSFPGSGFYTIVASPTPLQ